MLNVAEEVMKIVIGMHSVYSKIQLSLWYLFGALFGRNRHSDLPSTALS